MMIHAGNTKKLEGHDWQPMIAQSCTPATKTDLLRRLARHAMRHAPIQLFVPSDDYGYMFVRTASSAATRAVISVEGVEFEDSVGSPRVKDADIQPMIVADREKYLARVRRIKVNT